MLKNKQIIIRTNNRNFFLRKSCQGYAKILSYLSKLTGLVCPSISNNVKSLIKGGCSERICYLSALHKKFRKKLELPDDTRYSIDNQIGALYDLDFIFDLFGKITIKNETLISITEVERAIPTSEQLTHESPQVDAHKAIGTRNSTSRLVGTTMSPQKLGCY